jgi:hypothetical protein
VLFQFAMFGKRLHQVTEPSSKASGVHALQFMDTIFVSFFTETVALNTEKSVLKTGVVRRLFLSNQKEK